MSKVIFHIDYEDQSWDWEIITRDPTIDTLNKENSSCSVCKKSPISLSINEWKENFLHSMAYPHGFKRRNLCYTCSWDILNKISTKGYRLSSYYEAEPSEDDDEDTPLIKTKILSETEKTRYIDNLIEIINTDRKKFERWSQVSPRGEN